MTDFKKYMHLERYGNDEVQGIEFGECYIFPKIDGTNASVWLGPEKELVAGSRNRTLSLESDNAGFYSYARGSENLNELVRANPNYHFYGEWLVPHSLKTYRDDAWRKFYIFDVYSRIEDRYLSFEEYKETVMNFEADIIHPISIVRNSNYDQLIRQLDKNTFLIEEGKGVGEGIVIKNYDYQNRFGNTVFAKMITNAFKEKHVEAMGASILNAKKTAEEIIVEEIIDKHFVEKTYAKIVNECEGWNSKYIPRLLNTVYYDLINEELWNMLKKLKNPTINFSMLNRMVIMKIKTLMPELF